MAYLANSEIILADDQSALFPDCQCTDIKDPKYQFVTSNDYSRYILCCLQTTFKDGLMTYILPTSFKLYRGNSAYGQTPSAAKGTGHFYLNVYDASRQGPVHDYVVHQSPQLIGFDRPSNLTMVKAMAVTDRRYDVVQAFATNFQVIEGRVKKECDEIANYVILGYLCRLGYQGYITAPEQHCPTDVYLCDCEKYLSDGHYSPHSSQFVTSLSNYL
jgi:hypothetical protein